MRVVAFFAVVGVMMVSPGAQAVEAPAPQVQMAGAVGQLAIVQAVPGASVDVVIDGRSVQDDVVTGQVLGPFRLHPGTHQVDFSGADGVEAAATVMVSSGTSQDLVLHLPASVGGAAVVNSYQTPTDPIGPDKARVLIAHTATVAPADVRVDGKVVFANIANGEFATAEVPAGRHVVALLPTGQATDPILGPLDVNLVPRTVTMVYAVGNPSNGSMDLVVHRAQLAADGSLVPEAIDTGSAGLVRHLHVTPFGRQHPGSDF